MALTLKELMESRSKLARQDQAGEPERISVADFKKAMGVSTDTDKQTEILSNIELLNVKDSAIQKDQIEKSESLIEKDEENNTLLGNINNVLKQTLNENKKHTDSLNKIGTVERSAKQSTEQIVEGERNQTEILKLLHIIAENTADKYEPEKVNKKSKLPLGGIATAIALALGGIVGAIKGYVKAIVLMNKALFGAVEAGIAAIGKFFPNVRNLVASLEASAEIYIAIIKDSIGKFVSSIVEVFAKVKDNISDLVMKAMKSDVVKSFLGVITKTIDGIKSFFTPVVGAFKAIEESSSPVAKAVKVVEEGTKSFFSFFETIGTKIKAFAKVFKSVAIIFEKIAFPITVIMTAYDTIMGAIEGFKKDGIVGAISGAVKALYSSLITAPLDLLKDVVSWTLDQFGFDKASKFLDSFSFDDIMKDFVDKWTELIFHPIDTIKKLFDGAVVAIENIEIPEIGFTIPIIDKKVSIGPFHPFKKDEQTAPASSNQPQAPAPTAVDYKTVQEQGKPIADKGYGVLQKVTPKSVEQVPTTQEIKITQEPSAQRDTPKSEPTNIKYEQAFKSYKDQGISDRVADKLAKRDAGVEPGASPIAPVTAEVTPPAPTDASAVYSRSANNAQSAMDVQRGTSPVIVNAPVQNTSVNNNQNISMPKPTRNTDSGFSKYLRDNAIFV